MKRTLLAAFFLLAGLGCVNSSFAEAQVQPSGNNQSIALTGAKIYTSPTAQAIINGVVLVSNGKIVAVGDSRQITIPKNSTVLDCRGLTLTAAFWNSHVHFTEEKWQSAAKLPAAQLAQQMQDMLTRYGFAHVLDTGSDTENTLTLWRRIEKENIAGPSIHLAAGSFVPRDGTPFYLEPLKLPELTSPEQATQVISQAPGEGIDGIKIFVASPKRGAPPVVMPLDIAKAVATAAQARGKFVIAHPTNSAGVEVVVGSGVDMLAHTTPDGGEMWSDDLVKRLKAANTALIPTLRLWRFELERNKLPPERIQPFVDLALRQLRAYSQAGGEILFGTDVGYMSIYSTADEYALMAQAGMSYQQILASLTTAPAARFGVAQQTGTIARGMDADIVVLTADPATNIRALADVRYTLRKGKVIFGVK